MKKSKSTAYYVSSVVVYLGVMSSTVSEVVKPGPFHGSGAFQHWSAVIALLLVTAGLIVAAWQLLAQQKSNKASRDVGN